MKLVTPIVIAFSLVITGCTQTPVPYKLVESVNYKPGDLAGDYRIGVTEEKVNDTEYLVTVKLELASSPKRAASMGIYHGALLAESYGTERFTVSKPRTGGWCGRSKNSKTGAIIVTDGGPQVQMKVRFLENGQVKKTSKKMKVLKTLEAKDKYFAMMNKPLSEDEMEHNSDRRLTSCWKRYR